MDPRGHRHQLEPRFREDSSASGVRSRAVQLLELTAAECPDLLLWTVEVCWSSGLRFELVELARDWGVRRLDLPAAIAKASVDVDRLSRLRVAGRSVDAILDAEGVNLAAVLALARARHDRTGRPSPRILRRLEQADHHRSKREWLVDWLRQPGLSKIDFELYGL